MSVTQTEVFRVIDKTTTQLEKDIRHYLRRQKFPWKLLNRHTRVHEDTLLALQSRIRDFEVLKQFITTRIPNFTPYVQIMWVDANRLKHGKQLLGKNYSQQTKEVILPFLAFNFQKS